MCVGVGCREEVIPCEELEQALTRLKETSGEAKVRSLVSVLDPDHDGNINIREIAEVSGECVRSPHHVLCVCAGDRESGTGRRRHSTTARCTHKTFDRERG